MVGAPASARTDLLRPALTQAVLDAIEDRFKESVRQVNNIELLLLGTLLPGLSDDLDAPVSETVSRADVRALTFPVPQRVQEREAFLRLGASVFAAGVLRAREEDERGRRLRALRPSFADGELPDVDDPARWLSIIDASVAGAFGPEAPLPTAGLAWYSDHALRLAREYDEQKLAWVKQVITDGIEQGWTNRQVMDEVGNVFHSFSKHRLENIARTESSQVFNRGRVIEMQTNDDIIGYEVDAIMDDRACPICRQLDGKRFPKEEIDGRVPPYHYMCRCVLKAIFAWEEGLLEEPGRDWPEDDDVFEGFGRFDPEQMELAEEIVRAS